jgi:hypothetical protein
MRRNRRQRDSCARQRPPGDNGRTPSNPKNILLDPARPLNWGEKMETGGTPPGLVAPVGAWAGKIAFRRARYALSAAEKLAFQRQALPYLRTLFPDLMESNEMGDFDARGADHYSFDSDGNLDAVIQCKGFSVTPAEVGRPQARQCVRSIDRFRSANHQARIYLLLHNRDHRNPDFTEVVLTALKRLLDDGLVAWAGMWEPKDLLEHVCQELVKRVAATAREASAQAMHDASALLRSETVNEVPFNEYELVVSGSGLTEPRSMATNVADPVPILRQRREGVSLVLGSFGYGKTTIAIRTVVSAGLNALFLPAARLSTDMSSARQLLGTLDDSTLAALPDSDRPVLEPLVRLAIERLLISPQDDLALVVDGLDEAPIVGRRNGVATVFNALRTVRMPILVTMRSEFWYVKRTELNAELLGVGPQSYGHYLQVLELLPWDREEILRFLDLQVTSATAAQQNRMRDFRDVVSAERYEEYYGDIPRRPLFLRMIVDDVLAAGVRARSRLELFDGWITNKLIRDWYNPTQMGGEGRVPILDRDAGVDDDMRTARTIMLCAARIMVTETEGGLELTADVSVDELRSAVNPADANFNVGALSMSSLLIPIGKPRSGRALRLGFAHRAFQEFFLAESFLILPDHAKEANLPDAVLDWLQEMRMVGPT